MFFCCWCLPGGTVHEVQPAAVEPSYSVLMLPSVIVRLKPWAISTPNILLLYWLLGIFFRQWLLNRTLLCWCCWQQLPPATGYGILYECYTHFSRDRSAHRYYLLILGKLHEYSEELHELPNAYRCGVQFSWGWAMGAASVAQLIKLLQLTDCVDSHTDGSSAHDGWGLYW